MSFEITYTTLHEYNAGLPGIDLAIALQANQKMAGLFAKLDTGSSHCIIERRYGDDLLFDIENGYELKINTATGIFTAYGHEVMLSVGEFDFDVMVYFAKEYSFNRNVLGRNGFLQLARVGIIDYEGKLFLSRYNS